MHAHYWSVEKEVGRRILDCIVSRNGMVALTVFIHVSFFTAAARTSARWSMLL